MDCETTELAEKVKEQLQKKKYIEGIKIKTSQLKITSKDEGSNGKKANDRRKYINLLSKDTFQTQVFLEKYSNKIMCSDLPADITESELKELFPTHLQLDLKMGIKPKAILTYSSAKEAMEARMSVRPLINGIYKFRVIVLPLQKNTKEPQVGTKRKAEALDEDEAMEAMDEAPVKSKKNKKISEKPVESKATPKKSKKNQKKAKKVEVEVDEDMDDSD